MDGVTDPPFTTAARTHSQTERVALGKLARERVPLAAHAIWSPPAERPDSIDLLQAGDSTRLPELLPIRYARMSASALAFLRGSAAIMASDLATLPRSEIPTQLCGDAHLANFGAYATPERNLVFDVNDFDETLTGPFEWDVKRLAVSAYVACRANACSEEHCSGAAHAAAHSYRKHINAYAELGYLEVWYARVDAQAVVDAMPPAARAATAHVLEKAHHHDSLQALEKLTGVQAGKLRIIDAPPLVEHEADGDGQVSHFLRTLVREYLASLSEDRRALLQRYSYVDSARKVVGVGSVGTRCFIALLMGASLHDPLMLQIKEAGPSVLERYLGPSRYAQHGRRIVRGQQLMQAASDIFLGWGHVAPTHFYIRQLRDMKASIDITRLNAADLHAYAGLCGWALARAHARSGDPAQISGYIGHGDAFEHAMQSFARSYADQNERDFEALNAAIASGALQAESSV
jgi:uncharacterized protein (DUF2252 family)